MNSKQHRKCPFAFEIDSAHNYFQFIAIRSCTKMPMLSTLCISEKLELVNNLEISA